MFKEVGTISRNTLVSNVVKELRAMLTEGKIQPGEFLPPQKELAAQFGVGLSTIREAIQVLTAMGLVQSHPGKGTWVSENAASQLSYLAEAQARLGELKARQVYEARGVIEIGLTQMAAERATPEDLRRIWEMHEWVETATNDEEFIEADLAFHSAVATAAHNELLEQFYYLTRSLLSQVIQEIIQLPDVKSESIPLQRNIAMAISSGDVEQAKRAAQSHWDYIENMLGKYD